MHHYLLNKIIYSKIISGTAAHMAAYNGKLEALKVLVEKGRADLSIKNNDGQNST